MFRRGGLLKNVWRSRFSSLKWNNLNAVSSNKIKFEEEEEKEKLGKDKKTLYENISFIMHPAQPSEARLGGVHFIFRHIQICTRLLKGELFRGYYVYCMHI